MLRTSCLKLEINEFRCYEAKVEESEKAGSCQESNPGLNYTPLSHTSQTTTSPTILYMYCTGGTECLSHTPGSHSVLCRQNSVRG